MPLMIGKKFLNGVPVNHWMPCAKSSTDTSVIFEPGECWDKLNAAFGITDPARWPERLGTTRILHVNATKPKGPPPPPVMVPVEVLSAEERVGLGDVIEAGAKLVGLDRLAAWYEKTTGRPCGCKTRREFLNRIRLWRKAGGE